METLDDLIRRDFGRINIDTLNPLILNPNNNIDILSISPQMLFRTNPRRGFNNRSCEMMNRNCGMPRNCKCNRNMKRCQNFLLIGLLVILFVFLIAYILKKVFKYKIF